MYKQIIGCLILFMLMFLQITVSVAQDGKSREGAFIRSLVVPGWGHYYVNQEKWRRGQVHLGAEIALIASYFGFSTRAKNLENQYETLALLKAGVSISDRSRSFQLAMGDFNTLREYNEYQLRSRNWNRLYEDQTENRWNWKTTEDRNKYNDLRSDVDRVENQLPAILGLMVVNRVISALSAYNRAKTQLNVPEITLMPLMIDEKKVGVTARLTLNF